MGQLHKVAETKDVPPGMGMAVEIGDMRLALFNVGGTYFAIDDTCPHSGGPLSDGDVEDQQVVCPWHGATFNLADGSVQCPPAEEGVTCYRVELDGDDIKIEIP